MQAFPRPYFLFCCIYSGAFWSDFIMEAHTMSLDQNALFGAIWSGFKLFAIEYKQTRMQKINTVTSWKMFNVNFICQLLQLICLRFLLYHTG